MRFAEIGWRVGAVGVLVLAGTGCASLTEPLKPVAQVAQNTSAPSAGVAAPAARVGVAEAPVSPTVQRAFDDASRALREGRTADAERGFRALAQANPELGGPHANLGLILRQAGKLPEAIAEFEKAVALNPKQPIYFNQLGVTYRQHGLFAKARDAYEKAIALDPGYAAPTLNLGILNDLYLGDGPRALALYDRYLALSPSGDAVVTKWVAELKNRKGAAVALSRKEKA